MKNFFTSSFNTLILFGKSIGLKINIIVITIVIFAIFGLVGWITAIHYYRIATALPLISNDVLAQQTLAQTTSNATWQTVTVARGDTLQRIFKHLHLSNEELAEIMSLGPSTQLLKKIKPGQKIRFLINSDQQLQQLIYNNSQKTLTIIRTETGFSTNNDSAINSTTSTNENITPIAQQIENNISANNSLSGTQINKNIKYGFAIAQKSLFDAGVQAGLSHRQAMQLVTLFSENANLARNIRRGDQLSVLYQPQTNYILLAQLTHRNKIYQIYRFTDPKGNTDYYTQDGLSLHAPIARAPLNYSHISSRFSAHRWQPVLHFFRPHYGVDYAAPVGTPIKAAGDGHIIFLGIENGYGKTIKIKHMSPYETVYAHMSHFATGLYDGANVHQGQVIGYVGNTGLSTGAHLHFEIRVNNIPHNPLTVALPSGTPIENNDRLKFLASSKLLLTQLTLHQAATKLATR